MMELIENICFGTMLLFITAYDTENVRLTYSVIGLLPVNLTTSEITTIMSYYHETMSVVSFLVVACDAVRLDEWWA